MYTINHAQIHMHVVRTIDTMNIYAYVHCLTLYVRLPIIFICHHNETDHVFAISHTVYASQFHHRNCKKISPTITQLAGEYPHIKFVKVRAVYKCLHVFVLCVVV